MSNPDPELPEAELDAYIDCVAGVRLGKPTVRGTRVTVEEVVGAVASGLALAEVAHEFTIEEAAVRAALR